MAGSNDFVFLGPDGAVAQKTGAQQSKGVPAQIVLTDWEKALLQQGEAVLSETWKVLGVEPAV